MAEGDAVKVCVRVRPLIHREQGEQVNVLWQANNNVISQVDGSRSFTFDRVFPLHETTAEVYRDAAVPIIRSVLQGYNGTIFAYGQTSSGKTFTMMGTKDNPGIISLAIQEVFRIIQEDPTREFLLRVSYMEIYNETVTDLLCDDRRRKPLDVREDINRNVYVADLTDELVMTPEHVMQWIKRGEKNRHYGETKMNDRSSRSHAIFRMIIESRERIESGNAENCDGAVMVSHLNLVDLAGSERASQTAAEGVRLKEGCNINRSLFVLGQVIKKLSDGQVGGFINYRDSKLTRILQNSFGGNTKTVVICTVTPVSLDETLSTLQFASTAKHVRNTPHVNEVLDDQALLKRYQKQILDLKKQVENASSEIRAQAMAKEEHSQLLAEIKQLLKEKEDRIWNLSNVVIGSSQQAREDQRVKLKRRVTWAPGKIQASLCSAGDSSFQMGSTLTMSFAKRPKMSEPLSIPEIDDSICAETSVFEGAGCALDNSAQDPTWNFESGVTSREKMTALSHSMIDFSSESTSALTKDSSLQKCKELEQNVAELEEELKRRNEEYEAVVRKRDCLVNVTADLEEKLHSEDKDELQITSLSDRSESVPDGNEQNPMPEGSLEMPGKLSPLKTDEQELEKLNDSPLSNRTDGVDQDPVLGLLASPIHDLCREQIQMLEQKIADLEGNESPVNDMEAELCSLRHEKLNLEEKLFSLQQHIDKMTSESDELKTTLQSLVSERDQMKEDLRENVEMSIETQDHLREAQHDLQQQKLSIEELTCQIASLEQKSSILNHELQETIAVLKESNNERDLLEQMKQKLVLELEHLHNDIKNKELTIGESEKERTEAEQKVLALTVQLKSMSEEREELQKQSAETEEELKRTQEELDQQKQGVEKLANEISLLEEKSSELERELQEKIHILNKAVEDRHIFDQSKQGLVSEMEQVMEDLKNKDSDLKQAEKEKEAVSQKILELTNKMQSIAQERDDLVHSKKKLEEEAEKLREEFQQLKHEHNLLADQQTRKTSQIDELETELQQMQEKMRLSDTSIKQLGNEKVALQKQLQQCELKVASLHQEQEQMQQLLERVRSEKQTIYASLQDQEKAVAQLQDELITSQTKLETVKEECNERNAQLAEKVNEVTELLKEKASVEEENEQWVVKVSDEMVKNWKLEKKISFLESLVTLLRSTRNETSEEVDQLAVCTESLERKNQEWKDLVENVSTIYTNHSLLKNLSRDLKRETEAQKQSMSAIKEGLSSTLSKTFGNLETEHTKLNSQIENLLHKFKVIDRSSVVKDKNYELVQDYESELCEVQKKNQELLLQCRSLEQHGTRWSKEAAKELKSRQAEYMNQLIIKKTDMMTLVVDDLSEAQVELNGIETDLKKEMQCKKEFTVWLEEFKDLHCDTTRLSDRVLGENRRIAGLIEHLTRRLKIIIQPKIKRDTVTYLKSLDADLEKKKKENKELLQKIQQIAPSVNSDILEEENVRLRETLKDVQAELKEKQRLVQSLENELSSAKADAKEKAEKALLLEEQLRSNTAESALSEMEVKMNEKEKHFQAALEEIQVLQEKVSKGAAPYKNEIERLRDQVVKGEMDRMKLTKSTEQQISSLKACVEDKEERLRKLREQLRRSQKDLDDTVGPGSSSAPAYPLTCGDGSGIVQSTAMLVLQSKNAELKREIAQYKRKCHQLSSNISSYEEELKQLKKQSPKTPTTLLSSLHDDMMSHSNTDLCSATEVSPRKSEMSSCYITSLGKTGLQRKRDLSQSKTVTHKPPPMSPNRERHSVPASSPGNTDHYRKHPASPHKTDGPLFSTLTASPCKKQKLPVKTDSPKEKFFDVRSKSLPYWPDKFFDNSNLGTLSDKTLHTGATETTSDVNNWWDKAPTDKPNECKAS
ncbi:centromere-associated protein E-like isoform X2 [Eleutherodactylus coqui]|uniref:centromere-associated protein E-like isoform X2 n=1 Tax=Eleutherodactylus coqui TaxID=57060 RepID=UPI0034631713